MGYPKKLARHFNIDSVMGGQFDSDAQPSANLTSKQTGPKRLQELDEWAQKHGEPGKAPGSRRVDGFSMSSDDLPDSADMLKTTREQYHRDHVYGPEMWGKIKDSLLSPGLRGQFMTQPNHQRVADWGNPLYVFSGDGIDANASSAAWANSSAGVVGMNPEGLKGAHGVNPSAVFRHEMGHIMNDTGKNYLNERANPPLKATVESLGGRVRETVIPHDKAWQALANAHAVSGHINYTNTMAEFMAEYSRLKGMNYGLTGKVPMTPQEHIDMLKQALSEPIKVDLTKGFGPLSAPDGGPAPTMRYGPQDGRKAHGYNELKFYLQGVLQDIDEWDMEILGQLGPHIVSNGANPHAATT